MDEHKERIDDILEKRLRREDRRPRKRSEKARKKQESSADNLTGSPEDMYGSQDDNLEGKAKTKKKRGCLGTVIRILLIILLLALVWFGVDMGREYFRKTRSGGKDVEIQVKKGDGLTGITRELRKKGIVKYGLPFVIKVRLSGRGGDLR